MSRIVVTTLGSLGDLHPKIAIALELRQRGHDVVFATHHTYRSQIVDLGLEFREIRPDLPPIDDLQTLARMMDLRTGTKSVVDWAMASLPDTYADLMAIAKDADIVIAGELVYAARLVAEKLGIEWVLGVLQPTSFFSIYDLPVRAEYPLLDKLRGLGSGVNRSVIFFGKLISNSWARPLYRFRAELGLPPLVGNPFIDDKYSPHLVLALFSAIVVPPQPDWAAKTIVTGFTFYDRASETAPIPALQQFLDAGAPPIVFTLGSAAVGTPGSFYTESVAAAQKLNQRAVLLIGQNPVPADLDAQMLAIDYAPYSQLFDRARAIVHQGGIGTTAQALRAGRPTLIMPYSHDQPDNAARVERLGTSRTISRDRYTADRVARELRELLENPRYAAAATVIGQQIRAENGVVVACEAIERLLAGDRLDAKKTQ